MLRCSIGQEQQINFGKKVAKDLKEALATGQAFDVKDYMKKIYDKVMDVSDNNEAKALDYARLVPIWIDQFASRSLEIKNKLRDQGFSRDALDEIIIRTSDEVSGLENTKQELGIRRLQDVADGLADVTDNTSDPEVDEGEPESEDPAGTPPPTTGGENIVRNIIRRVKGFFDKAWHAFAPTMFSDMSLEAPYGKNDPNRNIPFTGNTAFLYKVKRNLIQELKKQTSSGFNSADPNFDFYGFGKVYLTAMSISQIEDRVGDDIDLSKDPDRKGVLLVLTDASGDPFEFDQDGVPTLGTGKIAYYKMRSTDRYFNGDGSFKGTDSFTADDKERINSLKRTLKISEAAAIEKFKNEITSLNDIRRHIAKDKTTNTVELAITGGSMGFIETDVIKFRNPLKNANEQFKFKVAKPEDVSLGIGMVEGHSYFFPEGTYGQPLQVERPTIGKNVITSKDEFTNRDLLLDLILGNIRDEFGNDLAYSQRKKFLSTFLNQTAERLTLAELKEGESGGLLNHKIILQGKRLSTNTPEELAQARQKILDYFTLLTPQNEITQSQVNGRTIVSSIEGARPNNILRLPSGKLWVLGQTKIAIDNQLVEQDMFDMPVLNKQDDGSFVLTTERMSYHQFLIDNFYSSADVNSQGKFVKLNSYFTFELTDKGNNQLYPDTVQERNNTTPDPIVTRSQNVPSSEPNTQEDPDDFLNNARNLSDDELYKILDVKEKELSATAEQIREAKTWYENLKWKDPKTGEEIYMNNLLPFKEAFRAINTRNPKAVASWAISGITLFKGADYSDLYHEAWHGFTQAFMSIDQKKSLYQEVRSKKGSFKTFEGRTVKFADASFMEIEEWLAEEFRQFMLKGQKPTKNEPVKNNIFQKIWNFLKMLFNEGTSEYSIMLNEKADQKINELFEKLRVGDLYEYNFSADNMMFGELQSGILALENRNGVNQINNEDTQRINETIDSLFAEFIDAVNSGLSIKEQNELAVLKSQFAGDYYKRIPRAEREALIQADNLRMEELKSKASYTATRDIVKKDSVRLEAYKYVQYRLKKIYDNYKELYDNEPDSLKKDLIGKDLELIGFALNEFGKKDADGNLLELKEQMPKPGEKIRGVIANHMFKSKLFSDAEVVLDFENMNEEDTFMKGREGYNRAGTETSLKELAKTEILYLFKTLQKTEEDGITRKLNRFGVPELEEFQAVWNRVARVTQNSSSIDDMYNRLIKESASYPPVRQILDRLGPLYDENIKKPQMEMWTNFWQAFNKTRIPLIQLTVTRSVSGEGTEYTSKVGEAFNADYAIGRRWNNQFMATRPGESKYILSDKNGPYLDIQAVLDDFPASTINQNAFEFYKAIGFNLTDAQEIRNEISSNPRRFGANYFRKELEKLLTKKDRKGFLVKVRNLDQITENQSNRFKALQILEARYSDLISNFMVTNAEGNSQYEHSLNNTLTVIVNAINNADNYMSLISQRHMSYLDIRETLPDGSPNPNYNPFAEASVWLKSIFNLDVPQTDPKYGERRLKDNGDLVELRLTNLSGALLKEADDSSANGIASANADEATKLILDLHLSFAGTPELMRHADKGTSYSVVVDGPIRGGNNRHYIPAHLFAGPSSAYNKKLFDSLTPHLIAEIKRIRILKTMDPETYDFKYLKQGGDFSAFDDVLLPETRTLLLNLANGTLDIEDTINSNERLRKSIYDSLTSYFDSEYQEVSKLYKEYDFATSTITEQIIQEGKAEGVTMTLSSAKDALVKSYVYNNWIHNIESLAMFYGDLALYNHVKEEFHKRNAGAGSTGTIYRTDSAMQNYINRRLWETSYAKSLPEEDGIAQSLFDGTFATAVVKDQNMKSAYYDSYLAQLGEDAVGPYEKMTEADAQGLITFDAYRELKVAEGDWSDTQEALFRKIVKGERISPAQVKEFFPVIKAQYWGPLSHSNRLNLMAFHKYSLMPLIPSVVKNKNAEALHKKMLKEGIKYLTFESGSKVSTISKASGADTLYKENRTLELTEPFTKNTIHLEFLKNQLNIHSESKGKVIFSTQLRKLIEDGLMEAGVPTDFMSDETDINVRIKAWDAVQDKEGESNRYKLLKKYENSIERLTQFQKEKLLKEMNWTSRIENGTEILQGEMRDLIAFIKKSLTTKDLAEHELDFIDIDPRTGNIKNDLSLSLSVEQIEKALNSLMVKRLINQKVNGEGLIQVASTLFEEMNGAEGYDWTNASSEDNKKYNGTNDLPTYRKNADGTTAAMKVKVALRGQFVHLLDLTHNDGERIGSIERLNEMIKNDAWLDKEGKRHREMVTMVGVRIPVQGMNSMEFMEVYEFLPAEAGSIIIPPTEIVAKSGADFDVDKLTVMMPNIRKAKRERGMVSVEPQMWNYNEQELAEAYEVYKDAKTKIARGGMDLDAATELDAFLLNFTNRETGESLFISTEDMEKELLEMLIEEGELETFDEFKKRMLSDKAIQNDLITDIRNILSLPENYETLITPNSTDIAEPLAEELSQYVRPYNPLDVKNGQKRYVEKDGKRKDIISPTRALEIRYNLYKHSSNSVGKQTLGLGAVDNTYNALFNRIGMYMNPTAGITTEEYNELLDRQAAADAGEPGAKKLSKAEKKKLNSYYRQKLFMPHNKRKVGEEDAISLSHVRDAEGKYKVSDMINRLMNGWVDIAKSAWIFDIQGNKEVSPVLLFMLQAGVPFEQAVYFVSMPMVRSYVKEQKLAKSTFAIPLNKAPDAPQFYRSEARRQMLGGPQYGFDATADDLKYIGNTIKREATKRINENVLNANGEFDKDQLWAAIKAEATSRKNGEQHEYTDFDRAAFLHFLEIEEMAKSVRDVKMKMNVDTSKDGSLFEAENRITLIEALRKDSRIPTEMVDRLITDSPIGSFFIQPFQIELLGRVFPLRNHEELNYFIREKLASLSDEELAQATGGNDEQFVIDFKNDLPLYLLQNEIRGIRLADLETYNGYEIQNANIKRVPNLTFGAFVQDGVLYIDEKTINRDFIDRNFSKKEEMEKRGLAHVSNSAFQTVEEYHKFVLERETLRAKYKPLDLKDNLEFTELLSEIDADKKIAQRQEESVDNFKQRKITLAYERWLRNKALDNSYNYWKMFKSNNTYAQQLFAILDKHPDLKAYFSILNNISIQTTDNASNAGNFKNIALNDSKLDSDQINVAYENLKTLADPRAFKEIVKNKTPQEVQEITDIFKRLPLVAFLQSGFNTKSRYSLVRLVDSAPITRLLEKSTKALLRHFESRKVIRERKNLTIAEMGLSGILNDYFKKFKDANRSRMGKIRGKDYFTGVRFKQKPNGVLSGSYDLGINAEKTEILTVKKGDQKFDNHLRNPKKVGDLVVSNEKKYEISSVSTIKDNEGKVIAITYNGIEISETFDIVPPRSLTPGTQDYIQASPMETLTAMLQNNPENIYLYNHAINARSAGTSMDDSRLHNKASNVFGLPTRMYYSNPAGQERGSVIRDKDGDIDPDVKIAIDNAIEQLVEESVGKTIVFNNKGYGQDMLDTGTNGSMFAPQTFLYLSKQLFENFGYINPGYLKTGTGKAVVQEKQEVSDIKIKEVNKQAVLDFMNHCAGV